MKKLNVIIAGALAVLLLAACSNSSGGGVPVVVPSGGGSSGGSGGGGSGSDEISWTATPVSNGIQFSVNALPSKYWSHSVFIKDQYGTRGDFNWSNKATAWTGVYPLVTAGNEYTFTLQICKDNDTHSFSKKVTATGGLGELSYSTAGWSVTLSKKTKAQVISAVDYSFGTGSGEDFYAIADDAVMLCAETTGFSLTNSNIANALVKKGFYNGNGFDGVTWDGVWIGQVVDDNQYPKSAWTKNFFDQVTDSKMLTASNKKFFIEAMVIFDVPGYTDFSYGSASICSVAIEYPW